MIENERQYRITKAWLERFAQSAQEIGASDSVSDPLIHAAVVAQYESQIEELQRDLADYDALRGGQITSLDVESLTALPEALVRARIAAGMTQKDLAKRLGLKEQQVQRYEATRYKGVSLERAQEVVNALGAQIHESLTLPSAEKAS